MAHGKCWSCPVLTPGDAATIITLCILKSEEESNVKLLAFGDKRMKEIITSRETSMDELYKEMKDVRKLNIYLYSGGGLLTNNISFHFLQNWLRP